MKKILHDRIGTALLWIMGAAFLVTIFLWVIYREGVIWGWWEK